jgi:hypothetical protein
MQNVSMSIEVNHRILTIYLSGLPFYKAELYYVKHSG